MWGRMWGRMWGMCGGGCGVGGMEVLGGQSSLLNVVKFISGRRECSAMKRHEIM
jgi:hypothetical protein